MFIFASNQTTMELKYATKEELLPLVDTLVEFETFSGTKTGVLTEEDKKLWLPFCGKVNALTVRVKL